MTDQLDQLDQLEADLASVEEAMESLARIAADGGEGTLGVAQIEAGVSAERFADLSGERTSDDDAPADPNSPAESADSGPVPPRPFG